MAAGTALDPLALAEGGHSFGLVGPRRYGKTTLLLRVLEAAERDGTPTVLVDLQDVLSIAEIVVRIEHGYERLKGPIRRHVESLFRTWNIGLSLGGGGFTATLQRNPSVDAESVLLRVLELPMALFDREGTTSSSAGAAGGSHRRARESLSCGQEHGGHPHGQPGALAHQ